MHFYIVIYMFSSTVEIVKMTLYFQEFPSIIIFCSSLNFLDLLGMDESKRSGRSTRKALSDFTLMPSICRTAKSEENKLEERRCIYVLLFVYGVGNGMRPLLMSSIHLGF